MIDVLFIHSPMILYKDQADAAHFKAHGGDEKSLYPLGILYIAACLEKKGHSVKVIDVAAENKTLEDILSSIALEKPRIIGISSMTTSIHSAVSLAKSIRSRFGNDILIGLGGVHMCCDPTFLKRMPYFDFGITGEAEKTFVEVVEKVKEGKKVQGVILGEAYEDLDDIPFPARHLINAGIYKRDEQMKFEVPTAGILGSRGCPYGCSFCCIPAIGQKVRLRSAKNIVDEMESVYDLCQGQYNFNDDCMTLSKKHTLEFCQELIERKLKMRWIASTRANALDEEMVRALKRAGCTDLYFGVESGSEKIRNSVIKKKVTDEQIAKAVALCRKHRILSNLFLMVGFPGETKEDMLKTVHIGTKVKADVVGIHITMPLPGTEIFEYAVKKSMLPADIIDRYARGEMGRGFRDVWPLFVPEGFTLQDLIDIKIKTYRSFYINFFWILRRIRTWFILPKKFKDDLKLFKIAIYVFVKGGTKGQLS
ncbi:MAG: B12-binding domain-containing radical SAM protein [Candidatus Omnitrophica bacterium]|nr:B12-binding domain-containing radical SAM protein [Candidatus Omnitrophota bacterium]